VRRATLPPRQVAGDSHRPHGTYAKYVIERCGCSACRKANNDYELRRTRAIARPDEVWLPYVPAGPARRHLAELAANGVGYKTVARLSGVGTGTLSKLIYGDRTRGMAPSKRIRRTTLEAILAVRPEQATGAQKVPAGPTWALLDELLAAGYSRTHLAAALGSRGTRPALQVQRDMVRASTARKVERLHRRLKDVPPPPRRSRWST
jgi:hypothetical protein